MLTEIEYKKLLWHSRRGMLELDLLLLPFARETLQDLDEEQLSLYRALLQEQDQDLFAWLIEREAHPHAPTRALIGRIRECAAACGTH